MRRLACRRWPGQPPSTQEAAGQRIPTIPITTPRPYDLRPNPTHPGSRETVSSLHHLTLRLLTPHGSSVPMYVYHVLLLCVK